MRGEKTERVRELFLDPLTADQPYCAIARYVEMDPTNVMRIHRDLVAKGLVPDRPALPSRGRTYSKAERCRRLLLSGRGRMMSIKDCAREVNLCYRAAKRIHSALVAAGLLEHRRPRNRPSANGSQP